MKNGQDGACRCTGGAGATPFGPLQAFLHPLRRVFRWRAGASAVSPGSRNYRGRHMAHSWNTASRCNYMMMFCSPTGARTWDLRINRQSSTKTSLRAEIPGNCRGKEYSFVAARWVLPRTVGRIVPPVSHRAWARGPAFRTGCGEGPSLPFSPLTHHRH